MHAAGWLRQRRRVGQLIAENGSSLTPGEAGPQRGHPQPPRQRRRSRLGHATPLLNAHSPRGGRRRSGAKDEKPPATHGQAYTIMLVDLLPSVRATTQLRACASTAAAAPRANSRPGSNSTVSGSCRWPHLGGGPCFNGEPSGDARPPATPARWPLWRDSAARAPPRHAAPRAWKVPNAACRAGRLASVWPSDGRAPAERRHICSATVDN